jgi:cation diffusion facilitator CzcD-associated flavoprotein CzcO
MDAPPAQETVATGTVPEHGKPPEHVDVVIVGAGFSGIGMAMSLTRAGRRDFVILEQADEIGGTWRDNVYPGCACDTPSAFYAYSRGPRPDWSRRFALGEEIQRYLRDCVRGYGLGPHIRTGTAMMSAAFDESLGRWCVVTRRGVLSARILVLGLGALNVPAKPRIRGIASFTGTTVHTARWDHSGDLAGKRVAVIGTGASAAQVVPAIAAETAELHVYQRTPPWILPKRDRVFPPWERRLLRMFPALARLRRWGGHWRWEARGMALFHSWARRVLVATCRRHLRRQVADPALRARLTPSYVFGCKRVLLTDDYYPALTRPGVELVDTAISEITPAGIRTADGVDRPHDVIVFATGFHVTDLFGYLKLTGRGGLRIGQRWRDGVTAYLGMAVSDFPNLFFLLGPNSGSGHHSAIFTIEAQQRYIVRCLDLLDRAGATTIEVRRDAQEAFAREVRGRHTTAVWQTGGCDSWYLDRGGVNRALWPGYNGQYWLRVRTPDPGAYLLGTGGPPAGATPQRSGASTTPSTSARPATDSTTPRS